MAKVTAQECRELAALARLGLSDGEAEQFAGQLQEIVDTLQQLQAVDVTGVPEYLPGPETGVLLRPDRAGSRLPAEVALRGVPATADHCVAVPKFKED